MTDTPMTVAQDIALPPLELSRPRPRVRFLAAFMISLVAALGLGASGLYAFDRQYADRILPGVTIGGIDVGGMTPQEASSRLNQAFASFAQGKAVLTSGPLEMPIDYADINRRPDLEGMVAEAMAVGRSDKTVERIILDARTALRGVDLQPKVLFDAAKLARYVDASAARLTVIARDASVTATKTGYAVVDGVPGRKADRVGPTDLLAAVLARADAPGEIKVELRVGPSQPDVTTAEATAARAAAERMTADVAIVEGKEKWTIPAATVRSWLSFSASDGVYKPVVKPDGPAKALATVAKKIGQSPLNASFTIAGGRITGVTAARNGRALNLALTSTRIHALLAARAEAATSAPVTPVTTITAPALSTADATAVIGKMTKISTWTTWFPISERNHFGANIWIPAMDIDGTVVGPGETFDFWNAVGPISRAHGYGDGGAIINGKTEPQGALAGGICSNSTTLFNAVLRAGYKMGARKNHFYFIDRYPAGLDATVFKSNSGATATMSWTNDTAYPVLIRGYKIRSGAKGFVRYDIYSVPTGRKVVIGNPTIKNVRPSWDSVQYTSTLPAGSSKRIEFPVDGKDVWRTVTVYENGKIIHQTTYYSHYARITGVTLIGKG
jgi:vancomycin resistance protein YoaR